VLVDEDEVEKVPMMIPADGIGDGKTFSNTDDLKSNGYRLCFDIDSACHDSSKIFDAGAGDPLTFATNFSVSGPNKDYSYHNVSSNEHDNHLNIESCNWDSDWNEDTIPIYDSLITCVTCHNVHGAEGCADSTNEAMIRDEKLVDRRPNDREGFRFSYLIEDTDLGGDFVTSSGATREYSIGAVFRSGKIKMVLGDMCPGCHPGYGSIDDVSYDATENYLEYYREVPE